MAGKEAGRRRKPMKILVLGGTRFFGVHLVNALLEDGHEVTIATRGGRRIPSAAGGTYYCGADRWERYERGVPGCLV